MNEPEPDRSVDVALAEYNALRAELLGHTTSQNTVLGLGVTAIGVVLGLGINAPGQRAILVVVPVLAGIVILVTGASLIGSTSSETTPDSSCGHTSRVQRPRWDRCPGKRVSRISNRHGRIGY